jgi:hypothetical protein
MRPVGQGSGLGVGQVQQFAREAGGALEIKFEVGIGTALRVLLLTVVGPADGEGVDPSNLSATI